MIFSINYFFMIICGLQQRNICIIIALSWELKIICDFLYTLVHSKKEMIQRAHTKVTKVLYHRQKRRSVIHGCVSSNYFLCSPFICLFYSRKTVQIIYSSLNPSVKLFQKLLMRCVTKKIFVLCFVFPIQLCIYIHCNVYTFYVCPTFHCNPTVLFMFKYCTNYSGKM